MPITHRSAASRPRCSTASPAMQRLLHGFAQGWRGKTRDDALRAQMASDPHSPRRFRVLGPTRNVDLWYGAFDVKPGDKQYPEAGRSRQGVVVPRFGWRTSSGSRGLADGPQLVDPAVQHSKRRQVWLRFIFIVQSDRA